MRSKLYQDQPFMIIVYWDGMQASLVSPGCNSARVESQIMASDMGFPRALVGLPASQLRTRARALRSSGQVSLPRLDEVRELGDWLWEVEIAPFISPYSPHTSGLQLAPICAV